MTTVSPSELLFANLASLAARHDELLGRLEEEREAEGEAGEGEGEAEALAKLEPELQVFIARCCASGAVFDDFRDRTKVQAITDYWANILRRTGHATAYTRIEAFDGERLPTLADDACPYVGAEPLGASESCFGREDDLREVLGRLEKDSIVVIRGAGGSGKSSLLHAGVLPSLLAEGRLVVALRPGSTPFARLAAALGHALGREVSAKQLRNDPTSIREVLAQTPRTLVAIDQLEDIFILTGDAERGDFDKLLVAILDAKPGNQLLMCINEGLIQRLDWLPKLAARLDPKQSHVLRPLDGAALERAIALPAAKVNLELKPGVLEYLVRELRGDQALPLLQFTLRRLWSARERNRITLVGVKRVGEPAAAFNEDAERRYRAVAASEADIRRVLLELVRIDDRFDYHRQPARVEQVYELPGVDARTLLPKLVAEDFVRIIDDEIVELRDDATIHHWLRLVNWIKDQRKPASSHREALASSAQFWETSGRASEDLYRRPQITEARKLDGFTELEKRFLAASEAEVEREHAERERKHKTSISGLVGVIVALVGVVAGLASTLHFRSKASVAQEQAVAAETKAVTAEDKAVAAETKAVAAETKAVEAETNLQLATQDFQTEAQDLQVRIESLGNAEGDIEKADVDKVIISSRGMIDSLEERSIQSAEAESSAESTSNYWIQVASDRELSQAQDTLRGLQERMVRLDPSNQVFFMILKRRDYFVLMVGGYSTMWRAKREVAKPIADKLYPHGKFIRSLATFCPERNGLPGAPASVVGEELYECGEALPDPRISVEVPIEILPVEIPVEIPPDLPPDLPPT